MKDRLTGASLLNGPLTHGVYELPTAPTALAATTVHNSVQLLHHKFGHPSLSILKSITSRFNISVSDFNTFNCDACQCNKSHNLPFHRSTIRSYAPLDVIYTDLWSSLVPSLDNFKYYVILVITSPSIYGSIPLN